MATTEHSTNIIHSITAGGQSYEIHDAKAVHTLADIQALGLEGAFIFKGTVDTIDDLPSTGNKIGYVYHVTATGGEYVWAKVDDQIAEGWEEFGHHIFVEHTHNVIVSGTNSTSAVTGSATVTGGNSTSSVSVPNAPKVSASAKYTKVSSGNDTFVKSYPGATSKMVTTSIIPAGSEVDVISEVTPTTGSVTGVSGSTQASKATAGTAIAVAKAGTAKSIPNVTGNTGVTASKMSTTEYVVKPVVADGVLSFTAGTATDVNATNTTLGTAISIIPAVSNGTITPYTFADVTVPVAAAAASTFVTGITTGTESVATKGTAVTVATGSLASTGSGSSVMTGLGTATTAKALTSATLAAGTSTDGVHTGDDVTVETQTLSGTAAAQTWTQNTGSISGTAAAQTWTQASGVTGTPISN